MNNDTPRKPFAITFAENTEKLRVTGEFDAAQDLWVGQAEAVAGTSSSSWTTYSNGAGGSDSDGGSDTDSY